MKPIGMITIIDEYGKSRYVEATCISTFETLNSHDESSQKQTRVHHKNGTYFDSMEGALELFRSYSTLLNASRNQ